MRRRGSKMRQAGEKIWIQNVTNICSSMMQLQHACSWCSRSFMVLISGPNPSPWGCTWRSSVNLLHANLKKKSSSLNRRYRSVLHCTHPFLWSNVFTRTKQVQHDAQQFQILTLALVPKEDSPRLDLVWVSRVRTVPCRFSPCLCEQGRADTEEGGGGDKIQHTRNATLSYGLSNFNDIVCERA